jgi:hypothetical protein
MEKNYPVPFESSSPLPTENEVQACEKRLGVVLSDVFEEVTERKE